MLHYNIKACRPTRKAYNHIKRSAVKLSAGPRDSKCRRGWSRIIATSEPAMEIQHQHAAHPNKLPARHIKLPLRSPSDNALQTWESETSNKRKLRATLAGMSLVPCYSLFRELLSQELQTAAHSSRVPPCLHLVAYDCTYRVRTTASLEESPTLQKQLAHSYCY